MPTYKIKYYFDGNGEVEIQAKTKDEAREAFFEGQFENEREYGENYNIENITK